MKTSVIPVEQKYSEYKKKYSIFTTGIASAIRDWRFPKEHFLNINFTRDFVEYRKPIIINPRSPIREISRNCMLNAIHEFYNDFDTNKYIDFLKDDTEKYVASKVFTPVIWAKYRTLHGHFEKEHKKFAKQQKALKKVEIDDLKAGAQVKRQAKEKDQMLRMGNGDIEKGKGKFMERMVKQKKTKYEKVNDVSLTLEQDFLKWLDSREGQDFYKQMTCMAPTQFITSDWWWAYGEVSETTRLKVKTKKALLECLEKLSQHSKSKELKISGVVAWDVSKPYANPSTHTFIKGNTGPSCLNGSHRLSQDEKITIHGYWGLGQKYVTTEKTLQAWKLFPKQFEKLESRNKKIVSRMSVMYSVGKSLDRLIVLKRLRCGKIKKMEISVMFNGKESVNPLIIFEDEHCSTTKKETARAIERLEKERATKNERARRDGMRKKKQKTFGATVFG